MGKSIRVLADYGCHALWIVDSKRYENIAPDSPEISLSYGLAGRLKQWAAQYSSTLRSGYPLESGFTSSEDGREFYQTGMALAGEVKAELGDEWRVTYFDGMDGREIEIPSAA